MKFFLSSILLALAATAWSFTTTETVGSVTIVCSDATCTEELVARITSITPTGVPTDTSQEIPTITPTP
ncbi:hypothetical protein BT96DRAFT_996925 [Gymnopus androsaceus JB14]|uniref:Uncharacterized protein n=1 Tax=Gymnopus androsaceus JB14 TaxID=1447944 RepID=A0A6A4HG60_9AGAR|nr:hypothetical protein BT96DRAFT_996925 [Gymnopus androsaceus JB14]